MKNHREKKPTHDSLIGEIFSDAPIFEMRGNKEIVIEGSKGVIEYTDELIRINTSLGLVCFSGRNLNLKCITSGELIINGFILSIQFVV